MSLESLVCGGNFTQFAVKVFRRHALLFQDFEETRERRLRHSQLFREVLKLLRRNTFLTDNRDIPPRVTYHRAAPASSRLRDRLHDGCLHLDGKDAEHHQPDDPHHFRLGRRVLVSAGDVARARWTRAATRVAIAAMSAAMTGGCCHQGCPGGVGVTDGGEGCAGGVAGLCPAGDGGIGCCVIVTSRPALPTAGLPGPDVCWVMVERGRSAAMMTASTPRAATMIGGFVHHRTIGPSSSTWKCSFHTLSRMLVLRWVSSISHDGRRMW